LKGATAHKVLYPLLDAIGCATGKLHPAQWALAQPANVGPYTCLQGTMGGISLALRVQNQIHPADADNHALFITYRLVLTGPGTKRLAAPSSSIIPGINAVSFN